MRYISLKETETRKFAPDGKSKVKLNYRSVIEGMCCEAQETPQGGRSGFDREANRRAMRILDALEKAELGSVLVLEDADWDYLKARLANHTWAWADRAFEQFAVDIEQAAKDAPKAEEKVEALEGEAAHLNGGLLSSLSA